MEPPAASPPQEESVLSEEEERMIRDIESHLPDEIRKMPSQQKRAFLVSKILAVRKEFQREHQYFEKIKDYKPQSPELYDLKNWKFDERFDTILDKLKNGEEKYEYLEEVQHNIYRFPMLKPEFSKKLLEEVDYFEAWCKKNRVDILRPNSMNRYGAIMDHFGFEPVLRELIAQRITPLSRKVFPHIKKLDSHHGFIVSYQQGKDTKLAFHRDDSEVTLNLCLGRDFKGGELYFGGTRCRKHQQVPPSKDEAVFVSHQVGYGLLHLGAHRHAATEINSGRRENLILWCRSKDHRELNGDFVCSPWCGSHTKNRSEIDEKVKAEDQDISEGG
ncbi:hypothetical protein AAMO2058_001272500 [Amorphochlora amoebiformis]